MIMSFYLVKVKNAAREDVIIACDDGNEYSWDTERMSIAWSTHPGLGCWNCHLMIPFVISAIGTSQMPVLQACWSRHQYRNAKNVTNTSPVPTWPTVCIAVPTSGTEWSFWNCTIMFRRSHAASLSMAVRTAGIVL